tara:strand:- start:9 stop:338 length:330 start_codon:yes stop_codon:yes gene_type:complete
MSIPFECNNLEQVRAQIDRLDTQIVELIAERTTYVIQAAKFKKTKENVRVPKRIEEIIDRVRTLAHQFNLNPDVIDSIYRHIIETSIEEERRNWDLIRSGLNEKINKKI